MDWKRFLILSSVLLFFENCFLSTGIAKHIENYQQQKYENSDGSWCGFEKLYVLKLGH